MEPKTDESKPIILEYVSVAHYVSCVLLSSRSSRERGDKDGRRRLAISSPCSSPLSRYTPLQAVTKEIVLL